ncbi:MAG: protein phosphatase 2C domain-containing protein [Candidatus Thermoplasmatota archaeon]
MEIGKYTDVGMGREINEDDAVAQIARIVIGGKDHAMYILGVADGLGGHESGEVASAFVCQRLTLLAGWDVREGPTPKSLRHFVQYLHRKLRGMKTSGRYGDMGTTLTFGLVIRNKAYVVNVGDSRAYLFHDTKLRRITKDHSVVQELLDMGTIDPEEAFEHPMRHLVTQALGLENEIAPDVYELDLAKGDLLLFSTDGLHDTLRDTEIEALVSQNIEKSAQELVKLLVEEALDKEARDNVTVVVGRVV